ncbi:UDP-N-acetylmuramate--L-alanine ligase [Leptothoe spongobia]|uniref:UDP-N-acetylmuramate--L-alanine ligase n=1 Tax=Leptothoe spongobia TAU-MAC 1115 TaxID=1967444 RepID=A0A947GMK7_9CYAN|nr:UDP-N-acetylmuramate--L-alanine ligase [Leptothoe spongobia]MBT9315596.1 UDP-N-acetylmuramate--L-alanine ligase [Leptothoe spongobia TAU-MAC 1115]
MPRAVDFNGRPFHFIGVGGIGMSALAYVLAKRQLPVSGSDRRLTHITNRLQENGVQIFWSQVAENIAQVTQTISGDTEILPQVVCSTAIGPSNPEYKAAIDAGCPMFHRSDILAALMNDTQGIAVAGTHGKTTTSSMVGYLLMKAGVDPSIVIGGEVSAWQGNAYVGTSDYMVAEADESDGSLVKLSAAIGIITNIELDHPDHYSTLDEVVGIFKHFANQCGVVIGSADCETVLNQIQPTVTYSLRQESGADYIATDICETAQGTTAVIWEQGQRLGELYLTILGLHNLSNALAAIAVARRLGVEFDAIATIMSTFEGAKRRFDCRGFHNNILFVDDYAHHPSEIRVTLAAAKVKSTEVLPDVSQRRVIAVFQPHRYSRITTLLQEFAMAFTDADQVIVTDIYSAGEVNASGITGEDVISTIGEYHTQVSYVATLDDVKSKLASTLEPGDLVIFLTAGNLNQVIPDAMDYQLKLAEKAALTSV